MVKKRQSKSKPSDSSFPLNTASLVAVKLEGLRLDNPFAKTDFPTSASCSVTPGPWELRCLGSFHISHPLEAAVLLFQIQQNWKLVCCPKQSAYLPLKSTRPECVEVRSLSVRITVAYPKQQDTFQKANGCCVDRTQVCGKLWCMQNDEIKEESGDEDFRPHLTQPSAQGGHWALWGNRTYEGMLGSTFYFSL